MFDKCSVKEVRAWFCKHQPYVRTIDAAKWLIFELTRADYFDGHGVCMKLWYTWNGTISGSFMVYPGCMGEQFAKRTTSPGCMGEQFAKRTTSPGCMGEQFAKRTTSPNGKIGKPVTEKEMKSTVYCWYPVK